MHGFYIKTEYAVCWKGEHIHWTQRAMAWTALLPIPLNRTVRVRINSLREVRDRVKIGIFLYISGRPPEVQRPGVTDATVPDVARGTGPGEYSARTTTPPPFARGGVVPDATFTKGVAAVVSTCPSKPCASIEHGESLHQVSEGYRDSSISSKQSTGTKKGGRGSSWSHFAGGAMQLPTHCGETARASPGHPETQNKSHGDAVGTTPDLSVLVKSLSGGNTMKLKAAPSGWRKQCQWGGHVGLRQDGISRPFSHPEFEDLARR